MKPTYLSRLVRARRTATAPVARSTTAPSSSGATLLPVRDNDEGAAGEVPVRVAPAAGADGADRAGVTETSGATGAGVTGASTGSAATVIGTTTGSTSAPASSNRTTTSC